MCIADRTEDCAVEGFAPAEQALRRMRWVAAPGFSERIRDPEVICRLARHAPGLLVDGRTLALVQEHVLGPADIDLERFADCPCCFARQIRESGLWQGFADAFLRDVLPDLAELYEVVAGAEAVTRLHTRISPPEMTVDPTFSMIEGLEPPAPSTPPETRAVGEQCAASPGRDAGWLRAVAALVRR